MEITQIARNIRTQIKAAIAAGQLPEGTKCSVRSHRYTGGGSVSVELTSFPYPLLNQKWAALHVNDLPIPDGMCRYDSQASAAWTVLTEIVNRCRVGNYGGSVNFCINDELEIFKAEYTRTRPEIAEIDQYELKYAAEPTAAEEPEPEQAESADRPDESVQVESNQAPDVPPTEQLEGDNVVLFLVPPTKSKPSRVQQAQAALTEIDVACYQSRRTLSKHKINHWTDAQDLHDLMRASARVAIGAHVYALRMQYTCPIELCKALWQDAFIETVERARSAPSAEGTACQQSHAQHLLAAWAWVLDTIPRFS